jgi:ligand-binding sensor domain-containing protein
MKILEKPETRGVLLKTSAVFQPILLLQVLFLVLSLAMTKDCQAQEATSLPAPGNISSQQTPLNEGDPSRQPDPQRISDYIRRIFQDKNGHLWFGTNGDGVCRYDGKTLEYFSIQQGFGGVAVRAIVEDQSGDLLFGTEQGVTRYDGKSFTNYTEKDGLASSDVWSIAVDNKGLVWVGTLEGVSRFDGTSFTPFELPASEPDPLRGVTSAKIVHAILQDSHGKMWFATNGGAYIYDGKSLSNISEKDGLCHNSLNDIFEDKNGNIWFATHHNGVCRWDGKSFEHFTEAAGVIGTEAWKLYLDRSGNVWFPIEHSGIYRYDGKSFTNFNRKDGLNSAAIQCFMEDRQGRIWIGGVFGLFRYDGNSIFPVTKNGPWN